MRIRNLLPGGFAAGALVLALLGWSGAARPTPLLASTGTCGGYKGPQCERFETCVQWLFFKSCYEKWTYWPASDDTQPSDSTTKEIVAG